MTTQTSKKAALLPRDEAVIAAWWKHTPKSGDLLVTDGRTLSLVTEGARVPVAMWISTSPPRYIVPQNTPSFRMLEQAQRAVREHARFEAPANFAARLAALHKKAFGMVTPRDEAVIERWWQRRPMEGDLLFSDGETLSGMWEEVPTPLAVWQGWGTYKMVRTLDPKKLRVQQAIRLLAPVSGEDLNLHMAGGTSPMEVWEHDAPAFKPSISPALLLKIRRVVRQPAALGVFETLNHLQNVAHGAPPPEGGFFLGFKMGMRGLSRYVERMVGADAAQEPMDGLSRAAMLLKKIDAGRGTSRDFLNASGVLSASLSATLKSLGLATKLVVLPGSPRIMGLAPSTEDVGDPGVPEAVQNVFTETEKSLPPTARQPHADIDALYESARVAEEQQLDLLNRGSGLDSKIGARVVRPGEKVDLATEPGPVIMIGPLKKKARVIEKVTAEGQGLDSALDLVRSTVAVDTMEEVPQVLAELRKLGIKFARKPKNRFTSPTSVGYRDLMFNVVYPNGHIGEIQVNIKSMLVAKEMGHKFYERVRSIDAAKKLAGDPTLTPEEQAAVDLANDQQRKLYDEAYRQGASSRSKRGGMSDSGNYTYFMINGSPARVARGQYPIVTSPKGADVVFYDQQKFYREAQKVSEALYNMALAAIFTSPRKNASHVLPEDPWRYFQRVPGALLVNVSDLRAIRARQSGIEHANDHMRKAYNGQGEKRVPISLMDNGDGTYTVLDGNSTYANAVASGWKKIPGVVEEVGY